MLCRLCPECHFSFLKGDHNNVKEKSFVQNMRRRVHVPVHKAKISYSKECFFSLLCQFSLFFAGIMSFTLTMTAIFLPENVCKQCFLQLRDFSNQASRDYFRPDTDLQSSHAIHIWNIHANSFS